MCCRQPLRSTNLLPQSLQTNGRSPVWVRMWSSRLWGVRTFLPHSGHSTPVSRQIGLSSGSVLSSSWHKWGPWPQVVLKLFPQSAQLRYPPLVTTDMLCQRWQWFFRFFRYWKLRAQVGQGWSLRGGAEGWTSRTWTLRCTLELKVLLHAPQLYLGMRFSVRLEKHVLSFARYCFWWTHLTCFSRKSKSVKETVQCGHGKNSDDDST